MTERLLPKNLPAMIATAFMSEQKTPLHFWRKDFIKWNGYHYVALSDDEMDKVISTFLNAAMTKNAKDEIVPFPTSTRLVNEVRNAIIWHGNVLLSDEREISTGPNGERINLIPFYNGLLDIDTDELHPHNPDNLLFHVLPFDYQRNAYEPVEFNKFLNSMWPKDDGSIEALLEILGYMISGATDLHKIFILVGPPRSGKGTLEHLIAAMVGEKNVCGINVSDFAGQFGRQHMINKKIVFLPDMRNHSRGMTGSLTEHFLTISGGDKITISRKHKGSWEGVLPINIMLLSNDIPHLPDPTGTIPTRFLPLVMNESFLGKEDTNLLKRMIPEGPQIIHKLIGALKRLRERGHFTLTPNAKELLGRVKSASAPHLDYFEETLVEDQHGVLVKMRAFTEYVTWCNERKVYPLTYTIFCGQMKTQFPQLKDYRPMIEGKRPHCWKGIRFQDPDMMGIENPHMFAHMKKPSIFD